MQVYLQGSRDVPADYEAALTYLEQAAQLVCCVWDGARCEGGCDCVRLWARTGSVCTCFN